MTVGGGWGQVRMGEGVADSEGPTPQPGVLCPHQTVVHHIQEECRLDPSGCSEAG